MVAVTDEDRDRARRLLGALEHGAQLVTADGPRVELPEAVVAALSDVLEATAAGDDAIVVRTPDEISTEQAAAVLGVSRPTVVRMIDSGRLPAHMVGTHRRVQLRDLLAVRDASAKRRRAALDRMVEEAEELGLYDS
jgi:excisionase family DNA binding protein